MFDLPSTAALMEHELNFWVWNSTVEFAHLCYLHLIRSNWQLIRNVNVPSCKSQSLSLEGQLISFKVPMPAAALTHVCMSVQRILVWSVYIDVTSFSMEHVLTQALRLTHSVQCLPLLLRAVGLQRCWWGKLG